MSIARALLLVAILALQSCTGSQSALDPSGVEAERISTLSWILIGFCTAVFVLVCIITAVALFGGETSRKRVANERIIIGGGVVFPMMALSALLAYGFILMEIGGPASRAASDGQLRIEVVGERWWWRVTYIDETGRRIESANEIRLPVGSPVKLELTSADVIHSFWVPRLAGKLDMIPGRTNTLTLEVTEPGISRGQCAEYCGGAHALMSFFVIGMPEEEFSAWFQREANDAQVPDEEAAIQGHALFLASGCGGCHAVRGTQAEGRIGPDLTHVGSRHSLAAATLDNDAQAFARWIRDGRHVKPENLMPPYEIFTETQLLQLATYLDHLR